MLVGRTTIAVLSLAAVVGGCAQDDGTDAPASTTSISTTTTAPAGPLDAGMRQYREDEAAGVWQVQLRNRSDEPLRVTDLRVEWDGIEPVPDAHPDYSVGPGVAVDLTVPLARARCEDPEPDPATARAVVGVQRPDGTTAVVTAPVTDGFEVLARVRTRLCNQQAVTDAFEIGFDDQFIETAGVVPPEATGTLSVSRRRGVDGAPVDEAELVVDRMVDAGVLLDMSATRPAVSLPEGTDAATGAVRVVSSGRCDAHARADSKTTYKFTAVIRLDGQERRIDLHVPEPARPTLEHVIDRTCTGG